MPNHDNNQLTHQEAKASLGMATFLQDQLMPKGMEQGAEQPQEAPQQPEMAPQQEQSPQPQETAPPEEQAPTEPNNEVQDLTKNFDEFKGKIEGIIETKFNDLTKTLKDALKDE